jgi:anthranilate phosphoribosyltransferase
MNHWSNYLKQILGGQPLTETECQELMTGWLTGAIPPELSGAILTAWQLQGITGAELGALAQVLLAQATPFDQSTVNWPTPLLDTCGTGGDSANTFNISTAVALVVAGAGVAVAKHGNRAVSSRSGSADVLEALGINLGADTSRIVQAIAEVGITFLFAPHWHPAMKAIAPLRKSLGIRTVFNLLGPLVNPLRPTVQIVGVYRRELVSVMAEALQKLGMGKALCVHSREGLDEISLGASTDGALLEDHAVRSIEIDPRQFGIEPASLQQLQGGSVADNAQILTDILQGKGTSAQRDCVALNSGYALYLAGRCANPQAGLVLARDILRSGAGWEKLLALQQFLR